MKNVGNKNPIPYNYIEVVNKELGLIKILIMEWNGRSDNITLIRSPFYTS